MNLNVHNNIKIRISTNVDIDIRRPLVGNQAVRKNLASLSVGNSAVFAFCNLQSVVFVVLRVMQFGSL